jgi:hypothetical protein
MVSSYQSFEETVVGKSEDNAEGKLMESVQVE